MPSALNSRTIGAHGDSEAVAATVLATVSLVPRQVVFVERVDGCQAGCEAQIFEPPLFFNFRRPTLSNTSKQRLVRERLKNRRRTKVFVPTVAAVMASAGTIQQGHAAPPSNFTFDRR
jgi:hypothetical protein